MCESRAYSSQAGWRRCSAGTRAAEPQKGSQLSVIVQGGRWGVWLEPSALWRVWTSSGRAPRVPFSVLLSQVTAILHGAWQKCPGSFSGGVEPARLLIWGRQAWWRVELSHDWKGGTRVKSYTLSCERLSPSPPLLSGWLPASCSPGWGLKPSGGEGVHGYWHWRISRWERWLTAWSPFSQFHFSTSPPSATRTSG